MLSFARDGIISFSTAPLRLALNFGFIVSALSFLLGITAAIVKLTALYAVPGWASIAVGVGFLGGVQLVVLGVIGEYIAGIHEEVKQRPLYLVRDERGFGRADRTPK
jgi:dolichol-phosphate mannosyltransferase